MCAFRALFARDSGFRRNDRKKREWRIFAMPLESFFARLWIFGVFTRAVAREWQIRAGRFSHSLA
ncbi:MAG: hypothetical protein OXU61_11480 [Gammaproteobacteria bacterium]|nr:hypothetical protein [Gammaproteobacteria bacterium]